MPEQNRKNVMVLDMEVPPKRLRAYRFRAGGIRYKFVDQARNRWKLSFKVKGGMSIVVVMDRHFRQMLPESIQVNGFTWNWQRVHTGNHRSYMRWVPDAGGLSNGLPDKVALVVNEALQHLKLQADLLYERYQTAQAIEARRRIELEKKQLDERHARQRSHLKKVLQQL